MTRTQRNLGFGLILGAVLAAPAQADRTVMNDFFRLVYNDAGVSSLRRGPAPDAAEWLAPGATLGHVVVRYRMWTGPWREFATERLESQRTVKPSDEGSGQLLLVTNGSGWYDYFADLEFTERFRLEDRSLYWTLHFRNVTHKPIEIAELLIPLPFDVKDGSGPAGTLIRRGSIRGRGSYVVFAPVSGAGPCLLLLPVDACPLFEPAQTERNYAPVAVRAADARGIFVFGGPAAQPGESYTLTPKFTPGDELTYGFKLRWAADESRIPAILKEEGISAD